MTEEQVELPGMPDRCAEPVLSAREVRTAIAEVARLLESNDEDARRQGVELAAALTGRAALPSISTRIIHHGCLSSQKHGSVIQCWIAELAEEIYEAEGRPALPNMEVLSDEMDWLVEPDRLLLFHVLRAGGFVGLWKTCQGSGRRVYIWQRDGVPYGKRVLRSLARAERENHYRQTTGGLYFRELTALYTFLLANLLPGSHRTKARRLAKLLLGVS